MPPKRGQRKVHATKASHDDKKKPSSEEKQSKKFIINSDALKKKFYVFMIPAVLLPPLAWSQLVFSSMAARSDQHTESPDHDPTDLLFSNMVELYRDDQLYKLQKEREWDTKFTPNEKTPIASWISVEEVSREWEVLM